MFTINTAVTKRGVDGRFFAKLQAAETLYRRLCSIVPSSRSKEDYAWLGNIPVPREWVGDRQFAPLRDYEFTIRNKDWELSLGIDRSEWEDDQTGQINMRIDESAVRFARHPDRLLVDLINAGNGGTMGLSYDGQYFFDTDHSSGDSGSQSNSITHEVTTPASPTTAEFKAAFQKAVQQMIGFKDDRGENIYDAVTLGQGLELAVLVPTNMWWAANEALKVPIIGNTGNIIVNMAEPVAVPRLSASDSFFVADVSGELKAFIFQERRRVETELKDDRESKWIKYMADGRYNIGYGLWQKMVRVQLT